MIRELEAEFKPRMYRVLCFDGVDNYVRVPDSDLLRPVAITVIVWAKPVESLSGTTILIGKEHTGNKQGYRIWFKDYQKVVNYNFFGRRFALHSTKLNEWQMFAMSYDGVNTAKAYYNDEVIAEDTESYSGPLVHTTRDLTIGISEWSFNVWAYRGLIGLVYIYSRDLSESEIKYLYYNPFDPPDLEHLVLWLIPGSIDTANYKWWDISGKGNHGTIYGCVETDPVKPEVVVL